MNLSTFAPPEPAPRRSSQDVIESAYVTAAMRALLGRTGSVRNPDYLAHHFAGPVFRPLLRFPRLLRAYVEQRIPGCCFYHLIRTKHFDLALVDALCEGVDQLVLLGAGYDTRPYRFAAALRNVTTFELDLPGTQDVKRTTVGRVVRRQPNRVKFVPINFQKQDIAEVLLQHGYRPDLRSLFLWEGVTYFLTPQAIEATLRSIASNSSPGSRLVFDYALRSYVEGDLYYYGAREIARELRRIGEPHLFGLNADEIRTFLAGFGFVVDSDLGATELSDLHLRDEDGRLCGRPHEFNRIVRARLAHGGPS
jgi:methyltransferase (TIGR00027 family)